MPPRSVEPNQLRQSVAPNTLRGFDAPAGSWLARGATDAARSGLGAPVGPRARRQRPSITPRLAGRIGLLVAVAGVLPILSADPRWEEVGLGMMCAGVGLALLAAAPGVLRSQAAGVGRPGRWTLSVLLGAPRWAAPLVIGGGLLVAGLFLLADAFAGR